MNLLLQVFLHFGKDSTSELLRRVIEREIDREILCDLKMVVVSCGLVVVIKTSF